jgi:hypothetical protein
MCIGNTKAAIVPPAENIPHNSGSNFIKLPQEKVIMIPAIITDTPAQKISPIPHKMNLDISLPFILTGVTTGTKLNQVIEWRTAKARNITFAAIQKGFFIKFKN